MMTDLISMEATVYGRVQGVYFRAFVSGKANDLGLTGYVCNRPDGESVAVYAEGERERLETLREHLKKGPPLARVVRVAVKWSDYTGNFSRFKIRH